MTKVEKLCLAYEAFGRATAEVPGEHANMLAQSCLGVRAFLANASSTRQRCQSRLCKDLLHSLVANLMLRAFRRLATRQSRQNQANRPSTLNDRHVVIDFLIITYGASLLGWTPVALKMRRVIASDGNATLPLAQAPTPCESP
ncbi:hypothetical protein [Cupriavidus pampae]|uniref:hypothetical protein n=1 Tax=Cupriavidus pampae TaxID=659251 RepID=UPI001CC5ED16|nr:hypothetical protein [Cupriavidus pampae]